MLGKFLESLSRSIRRNLIREGIDPHFLDNLAKLSLSLSLRHRSCPNNNPFGPSVRTAYDINVDFASPVTAVLFYRSPLIRTFAHATPDRKSTRLNSSHLGI